MTTRSAQRSFANAVAGTASNGTSSGANQLSADPAATPPAVIRLVDLKLLAFWIHSPAAWFGLVETKFHKHGITDQVAMFDEVINSLSHDSTVIVLDLIQTPPPFAYQVVKGRLLQSHQLTPVQLVSKMLALPAMGDRKPSALLAAMPEYCPPDESGTLVVKVLFLQRLPAGLQALLGTSHQLGIRDLAVVADAHWAALSSTADGSVAAVTVEQVLSEDDTINAVLGGPAVRPKQSKGKGGHPQRKHAAGVDPPAGSTLCFYHFNYGAQAQRCRPPCTWQGN